MPFALVKTDDFTIRRANVAYARAAQKEIREAGTAPRRHKILFKLDSLCTGALLHDTHHTEKQRRAEYYQQAKTYVLTVYPMVEEGQAVCSYRDVTEERAMT